MNIQAEISWIQAELATVSDPELIKTLKNLLKNRQKNKDEVLKVKLKARALRSEEDISSGKVHSVEEANKRLNKILSNR